MKLAAKVTNGKLAPLDVGQFSLALQTFQAEPWFWLSFERDGETRSTQANRRWWGVVVPVVREFLSRGREVPLSKEQVHYVLVSAFAGADEIDPRLVPGGPPAPVPTHTMTRQQFHALGEKVESYYTREHGLIFPDLEIDAEATE